MKYSSKNGTMFEMLVKYIQETTRVYSETASEKDKKAIRYIKKCSTDFQKNRQSRQEQRRRGSNVVCATLS